MFARRLKEARLYVGLSQEQLGIEAGLDPMSASARMNRYELGKRAPAFVVVEQLASTLHIPAAYFYAADDVLARLLLRWAKLTVRDREQLARAAEQMDEARK